MFPQPLYDPSVWKYDLSPKRNRAEFWSELEKIIQMSDADVKNWSVMQIIFFS